MIVFDEGPALRFVTQPDHAHFSGELLGLWRSDGLPAHLRRAELIFAGREHDNGWREADAAPRWDRGRGRPVDFLTMPREGRIEIWERGTTRFAGSHPYAALLVARHAQALHGDRRGEAEWNDFLAYLEELERGLREETGVAEEEVAADYRFLDLADLISLAACTERSEPFERHGVRGLWQAGAVHLQPFPLAGATAFGVPCRRIPHREYRGDADLGGELAAARWEELRVRVVE
ncbi:MAG TPA: DUF3891 family protein [Thermoanaerobaculia bacterium]|nr:DUF3891 family protein [Thermoanaerobaculia bacterium]